MNPEKLQKTTCPRDCYDRCGILAVVRDGRVAEIRGDPDSPVSRGMLCAKCTIAYNGVWLDPARRVTQPLRRTGPKGEARFTEISWDEALDTVANRLQAIARDHGADKVLHAHYQGTYSAIACNFPCRFFHRYGATEVDPSTICDKAGHVALQGMFGTSFEGFDTRSRDDASCLVFEPVSVGKRRGLGGGLRGWLKGEGARGQRGGERKCAGAFGTKAQAEPFSEQAAVSRTRLQCNSLREDLMADKSSFTPDEWKKILEAPLLAGFAVSAAAGNTRRIRVRITVTSCWARGRGRGPVSAKPCYCSWDRRRNDAGTGNHLDGEQGMYLSSRPLHTAVPGFFASRVFRVASCPVPV